MFPSESLTDISHSNFFFLQNGDHILYIVLNVIVFY